MKASHKKRKEKGQPSDAVLFRQKKIRWSFPSYNCGPAISKMSGRTIILGPPTHSYVLQFSSIVHYRLQVLDGKIFGKNFFKILEKNFFKIFGKKFFLHSFLYFSLKIFPKKHKSMVILKNFWKKKFFSCPVIPKFSHFSSSSSL